MTTRVSAAMVGSSPATMTDTMTVDGVYGADYIITGLTAGRTLQFQNTPVGQKGSLWFNNSGGRTVTKGSGVVCDANFIATVSAAGFYWIEYWHIGSGSVLVKTTATMS